MVNAQHPTCSHSHMGFSLITVVSTRLTKNIALLDTYRQRFKRPLADRYSPITTKPVLNTTKTEFLHFRDRQRTKSQNQGKFTALDRGTMISTSIFYKKRSCRMSGPHLTPTLIDSRIMTQLHRVIQSSTLRPHRMHPSSPRHTI